MSQSIRAFLGYSGDGGNGQGSLSFIDFGVGVDGSDVDAVRDAEVHVMSSFSMVVMSRIGPGIEQGPHGTPPPRLTCVINRPPNPLISDVPPRHDPDCQTIGAQIVSIRAEAESIEVEPEALTSLGKIGSKTSLR